MGGGGYNFHFHQLSWIHGIVIGRVRSIDVTWAHSLNFSSHLIALRHRVLYLNSRAGIAMIIHKFNIWRITEFREISFYGLFFQIFFFKDQWKRIGYLPTVIIWNSNERFFYSYIQMWYTIYITNKNKVFGPLKATMLLLLFFEASFPV